MDNLKRKCVTEKKRYKKKIFTLFTTSIFFFDINTV